jgi:hypothetical protein
MPDILIRGMEMPTMEQAYKTLIVSYDGEVYEGVHPQPVTEKKEPIAQTVELPPHGDLISKQTALAALYSDYAYAAMDVIEEVPAIVPASEEGSNDK